MASKLPTVDIIIPVYRNIRGLGRCLRSIASQDYEQERITVFVVDNNGDIPSEIVSEFDLQIELLRESKIGSYAARNSGISHGKGEILAFTDSDCLPRPDWVRNGVRRLSSEAQLVVAGRIEITTSLKRPHPVELYDSVIGLRQEMFVDKVGFAATANMLVRRADMEMVGLFDDRLMSRGDYEWGCRATANGLRVIYDDSVSVFHPARSSYAELRQKAKRVAGGVAALEKLESTEKIRHPGCRQKNSTFFSSFRYVMATSKLDGIRQRIAVLWVALCVVYWTLLEKMRLRLGGECTR